MIQVCLIKAERTLSKYLYGLESDQRRKFCDF